MSQLSSPVRIGRYDLSNRFVMAPMTRSRADDEGVLTAPVATYYAQRTSAGLIISEGVFPTANGKGYVRTPGIETPAQVAAWKVVNDAVHAGGSRIFMQLMHCGRVSHPALLPAGQHPVAPSAIKPSGQTWTANGQEDFVTPHALTADEVRAIVSDYGAATRRAIEAGFDGVELHASSGYLPEQFLSSGSNHRDDQYGGSIENRARFILEVLDAMIKEAGADRVGIKISPEMNFNDVSDATPRETFTYLVQQLNPLGLAYLHVANFGPSRAYDAVLKPLFQGPYLVGGGFDRVSAEAALESGVASAAVFGAGFVANPDLPARLLAGAPLNPPDRATFYSGGAEGLIDYPTLDESQAA
jgi:N-ethylmaleimide reductase